MNALNKNLALYDELETSIKLVRLGLGEFQNLDMANDFYHLPFQLISSGLERLMKCHICLGCIENTGTYPDQKLFKLNLKHDLLKIKEYLIKNYYRTNDKQILVADLDFINNDKDLQIMIGLLSEFGKFARYYNLDVVTGETSSSIDVKTLWQEFETSLLLRNGSLVKQLSDFEKQKEVLDTVTRSIVIKLERFVRAISRQFTLGDLGGLALQYSPVIFHFLLLDDERLGTTDYRNETTKHKQKDNKIHKRTLIDEINSRTKYRNKRIAKSEFSGDWPFYSEEVIIENRDKHWCVVIIDGYDYALNGAAKGRYKLEDVHEAGMAILGVSIGPFISMALELGAGAKSK